MKTYHGKCSCGDIEYRFEEESINTAFCYCKECQITTGADKWFGVWVPIEKFTLTKGKPTIFTRIGDSGKEVNLHFCGCCGTTLCAEITVGHFYSVCASTVSENNAFLPNMAIYTASAPEWAVFPENVPKFDVLPPGLGD